MIGNGGESINAKRKIPVLALIIMVLLVGCNSSTYMYDEWKEMGMYDEIVAEIEPVKQGYEAGENLLSYLSSPTLLVYPQEMDEIGYGIECDCPWEPEHSCLILVRDEKLLYVGESDGLDPWGEAEDYPCIWES